MAAVIDSLLLLRCRSQLQSFWGDWQSGGVHEALLSVLGLVLLAQSRLSLGLPLLLLFADLASAFDSADRDDMLVAVFLAGVTGNYWLLLDDLLASDLSRIHLAGLTSSFFRLPAGTAQGRRLSVHLFNGQMRFLFDCIARHSTGVAPWSTTWPVNVLRCAFSLRNCSFRPLCSTSVASASASLTVSSPSVEQCSSILAALPCTGDRLAAIDGVGQFRIIAFQYIDDLVAPASSSEQAELIWQGCDEFTKLHGGRFNHGPQKSAILPIGHTRVVTDVLVSVVVYKYLGVLIDQWLTFSAHFKSLLSRGQAAFAELLGAAESCHLPVPVRMAAIPVRIEPIVLYGIEFCLGVPNAVKSLNQLQVSWAKSLLGISMSRAGTWPFLICECGWTRRLGTSMYARALMLKARASLLPASHPTSQLMLALHGGFAHSWLGQVADVQRHTEFGERIPDIGEVFSEADIALARSCPPTRRRLLTHYRRSFVDRVLDAYDLAALSTAGVSASWPYLRFQPSFCPLSPVLFGLSWGPRTWLHYQAWAVVRVTARWPLAVFDAGDLPQHLDSCPLCGLADVPISHLLAVCPGTDDAYADWVAAARLHLPAHARLDWPTLQHQLFCGIATDSLSDPPDARRARIRFVGVAFDAAIHAMRSLG